MTRVWISPLLQLLSAECLVSMRSDLDKGNSTPQSPVAPQYHQALLMKRVPQVNPGEQCAQHLCAQHLQASCCPGYGMLCFLHLPGIPIQLFQLFLLAERRLCSPESVMNSLEEHRSKCCSLSKGDGGFDSEGLGRPRGVPRKQGLTICEVGAEGKDSSSLSVSLLPQAVTKGEYHQHCASSWAEKTKAR